MSCLSNCASNWGSVITLTSIERSNLRLPVQRAKPQGHVILPRDMILTSTSFRQLFWTLQVTSPVAGFCLCNVEHSATAHTRLTSRSFFSSSVSGALVVAALGSWAVGMGPSATRAASAVRAIKETCATSLGMHFLSLDRRSHLVAGRAVSAAGPWVHH